MYVKMLYARMNPVVVNRMAVEGNADEQDEATFFFLNVQLF